MTNEAEEYYSKGKHYFALMEFGLALEAFNEALTIAQADPSMEEIELAKLYNDIALCYYHLFDASQAYDYLKRSIAIKERLLDPTASTLEVARANLKDIESEMKPKPPKTPKRSWQSFGRMIWLRYFKIGML